MEEILLHQELDDYEVELKVVEILLMKLEVLIERPEIQLQLRKKQWFQLKNF
jgi:hypothetical protein